MPRSCSHCGSDSVVEDELYSQTQWVCQDCGSVISEGTLTTILSEEQHSTAVPYYISTEVTKKPCPNLIKGLGRVRSLCRILRLPKEMESAVVSLYERAYQHPHFLNGRLVKKEMLGGSCVLSVCRQSNWPVAMGTISMLLDADPASIGALYHDLNKALNIEGTAACSFTELLESHCHEYKLGPRDVPDIYVESVERLVQRSTALLELAADVWLVTGRQPLPLLTACVYVAWQSLKPMARMKYTLNKFCELARLPKSKQSSMTRRDTVLRRVRELREALCKLGRVLPWLGGSTVEPSSVCTLVDDILSYRRTLMLQAMRSYELEEDAEEQSAASSEKEHWSKRHLFLPPSARNAKRPRPNSPEPDVSRDDDISDTEIESYIRSPEEVKNYLEVQKKLMEGKKSKEEVNTN
ncbi:transcription factor IIIB 50 kDa subunit isoform X2 [Neoarius graeffei]|uniref:transcription factor IIIB 50 kDa subunit isoform X2 n=1 Tax=Neoarius graeffei TaxID=443677 RepID=UPI00298C4670|nr:transcription factor IIIB 50 kDa subunit isoform X2 [Neoarius graeffei]